MRKTHLDELLERLELRIHASFASAGGDPRFERLHVGVGPHLISHLDVPTFLDKLEVARLSLGTLRLLLGGLCGSQVRVDGRGCCCSGRRRASDGTSVGL